MKLKCGGLQGLQSLKMTEPVSVDVNELLQQAITTFQDLEHLPYPNLVQAISSYQLRKRPKKPRKPPTP